uniref:SCP domain-containing protein n=1 Tax=Kalanchoe fedtschenkoi TaxID=63787 RepID=A0A7N0V410_KALFE
MDQNRLTLVASTLILLMAAKPAATQDGPRHLLDAHNAARAELGIQPIKWDRNVTRYARRYANTRRADCGLVHSNGPYGENIAMSTGDLSGVEAVKLWAGEKAYYDASSNSCIRGECLHYTQVVWANSTRLGCAKVRCDNGGTFITCNYDPPGNVVGWRPFGLNLTASLARTEG